MEATQDPGVHEVLGVSQKTSPSRHGRVLRRYLSSSLGHFLLSGSQRGNSSPSCATPRYPERYGTSEDATFFSPDGGPFAVQLGTKHHGEYLRPIANTMNLGGPDN